MAPERPAGGALHGIRVLDLTDELGAYAGRLLGDLGAEVIRIEPPGGSRTRAAAPRIRVRDGGAGRAYDAFVSAGKRSIVVDVARPAGRTILERLVGTADVLLESWSVEDVATWAPAPDALAGLNPRLVHVSITPFGRDRARPHVDDDDLTLLAAGGLLSFGGYPDTSPIAAYGGQSRNAASLFAAVGALVALLERQTTGHGRWIDVSAQEAVAQALEDSVAAYEMTGQIRRRNGATAAEAGTGMYPCADGLVSMVAGRVGTAKAWRALVAWLVEAGAPGAGELTRPAWSELSYRQGRDAVARFAAIFTGFTATRTRVELYEEAQARGIALSPVNDVAGVLADAQLAARGFWVTVPDAVAGREATFPGPPYRLSGTPARPARPAPALNADGEAVLGDELGLDAGTVARLAEGAA